MCAHASYQALYKRTTACDWRTQRERERDTQTNLRIRDLIDSKASNVLVRYHDDANSINDYEETERGFEYAMIVGGDTNE